MGMDKDTSVTSLFPSHEYLGNAGISRTSGSDSTKYDHHKMLVRLIHGDEQEYTQVLRRIDSELIQYR